MTPPDERAGFSHHPELDGLRGVAALIVVVSHASNGTNLWGALLGRGGGQLGVMLFFMLSGFLLGSIYLPRAWSARSVWDYAVHRVARVLPLFYILVTLSLALTWWNGWGGIDLAVYPVNNANVLQHYALLDGVAAFWTIPVEMAFYAIFIAIWLAWRWRPAAILLFALPCVAVYAGVFGSVPGIEAFVFYATFFMVGVLISRVAPHIARLLPAALWSAAFVVAVAGFILLYPNIAKALGFSIGQPWRDPLYIAGVTFLFVAALHAPLARLLLGNGAMQFIGRVSYSIYLLHLFVLTYLLRFTSLGTEPLVFTVVGTVLTIALAAVSFYLVEKPLLDGLRRRFSSERQPAERVVPVARAA